MKILTRRAVLNCDHVTGIVQMVASQSFVRIKGSPVLVKNDPENRPITGCPIVGPGVFPCLTTLKAQQGYSHFVRINGKRVCTNTIEGLTNGTPPGTVKYKVTSPGQTLVSTNK